MKKKLLSVSFVLLACMAANAQSNFAGNWYGTLHVAGDLRLVLHVTALPDGTYTGTLDSPDQNVSGIKCDTVTIANGDELNFTIKKIRVSYTGKLLNDTALSGTFTQGANIPLEFKRTAIPVVPIVRPQTPKPPFPYRNEEVVYSGNGLQYGGTLTIPFGSGPFPAVVLITGSGQQDRDETIFNHKPFAVLADALTRDGFIVLRVDDRGKGNSTGNFATSTSADFVKDINASVDYLKTRKEVNDKKVGLLGHSEGGMLAPMVASSRKDINFVVLLAAPGVKIIDLMAEQNAAVLKSLGIDAAVADNYKPVYTQIVNAIVNAPDSATAMNNAVNILNAWQSKTDTATLKKLGFEGRENNSDYIRNMMATVNTPWFKYFITFDPQPYLKKLKKVKVLALNGSRDIQVVPGQNLPAIQSALVSGSTRTFEVKELPGLNHLFQTCKTCTVMEYGQLQETIAPAALQTITDWLNNNVK